MVKTNRKWEARYEDKNPSCYQQLEPELAGECPLDSDSHYSGYGTDKIREVLDLTKSYFVICSSDKKSPTCVEPILARPYTNSKTCETSVSKCMYIKFS